PLRKAFLLRPRPAPPLRPADQPRAAATREGPARVPKARAGRCPARAGSRALSLPPGARGAAARNSSAPPPPLVRVQARRGEPGRTPTPSRPAALPAVREARPP